MNGTKKHIIERIIKIVLDNTKNNKLDIEEKEMNTYNIAVHLKNVITGNNVLEAIEFFYAIDDKEEQLSIELGFRTALEIIFSNNSRTVFCDDMYYGYGLIPQDLDIAGISDEQICEILDEWIFDKKPVVFRRSRIFDIIFR